MIIESTASSVSGWLPLASCWWIATSPSKGAKAIPTGYKWAAVSQCWAFEWVGTYAVKQSIECSIHQRQTVWPTIICLRSGQWKKQGASFYVHRSRTSRGGFTFQSFDPACRRESFWDFRYAFAFLVICSLATGSKKIGWNHLCKYILMVCRPSCKPVILVAKISNWHSKLLNGIRIAKFCSVCN